MLCAHAYAFHPRNEKRKVGCAYPMVVVSIAPYAGFGPNDHREDAPHFKNLLKIVNKNFDFHFLHAIFWPLDNFRHLEKIPNNKTCYNSKVKIYLYLNTVLI